MASAPRKGQFLFILLMAFFMSGTMSLTMTFIKIGFGSMLIHEWLKAWAIGFVVAVPTAMLVVPMVRTIVDRLVR
jgi:hypothetical protein